MTVVATASNPRFSVSRTDIDRPGPTYTVDTLRDLHETYGEGTELFFITGADALAQILGWHAADDLFQAAHFVGVSRPGYEPVDLSRFPDGTVTLVQVPALAISSSDCRDRVGRGHPVWYLVPGRRRAVHREAPAVPRGRVVSGRGAVRRERRRRRGRGIVLVLLAGRPGDAAGDGVAGRARAAGAAPGRSGAAARAAPLAWEPDPEPRGPPVAASERAVELGLAAAQAAADKLASDILLLDVSEQLVITDVFVLASAPSDRQVKAVVDEVEDRLRELGAKPVRREGTEEARWVLLDFAEIVVHVQHEEERVFYALERLWKDCPVIEFVDRDSGAAQPRAGRALSALSSGRAPRRVVLLRHGRTADNAGGRFQGQLDTPLDEVGPRAGRRRSPPCSRRPVRPCCSAATWRVPPRPPRRWRR